MSSTRVSNSGHTETTAILLFKISKKGSKIKHRSIVLRNKLGALIQFLIQSSNNICRLHTLLTSYAERCEISHFKKRNK